MKFVNFILMFFCTVSLALAEPAVDSYNSTDNIGLTKKQRIDSVETYLAKMASDINEMEKKFNEAQDKIKAMQKELDVLSDFKKAIDAKKKEEEDALKEAEDPKNKEKAKAKEKTELEKLKEDILALKNKDIEKLKMEMEYLREDMKNYIIKADKKKTY